MPSDAVSGRPEASGEQGRAGPGAGGKPEAEGGGEAQAMPESPEGKEGAPAMPESPEGKEGAPAMPESPEGKEGAPATHAVAEDDATPPPPPPPPGSSHLPPEPEEGMQPSGGGLESPHLVLAHPNLSPSVQSRADSHRRELAEAVPITPLDDAEPLASMRSAVMRSAEARYTYEALSPSPTVREPPAFSTPRHTAYTLRVASALDAAGDAAASAVARSRVARGGLPGSAPGHLPPQGTAAAQQAGGANALPAGLSPLGRQVAAAGADADGSPGASALPRGRDGWPTLVDQAMLAVPALAEWSYLPKHRKKRVLMLRGHLPAEPDAGPDGTSQAQAHLTPQPLASLDPRQPGTASSWSPAPGWVSVRLSVGRQFAEGERRAEQPPVQEPVQEPEKDQEGPAEADPYSAVALRPTDQAPYYLGKRGGLGPLQRAMQIASEVAHQMAHEAAVRAVPILWAPEYHRGLIRRLQKRIEELETLLERSVNFTRDFDLAEYRHLKALVPKLQADFELLEERDRDNNKLFDFLSTRVRLARISHLVNQAGSKLRLAPLKVKAFRFDNDHQNALRRMAYLESTGFSKYSELERVLANIGGDFGSTDEADIEAAAWDIEGLKSKIAPAVELLAQSLGTGTAVLLALTPGAPQDAIDAVGPEEMRNQQSKSLVDILNDRYQKEPLVVEIYKVCEEQHIASLGTEGIGASVARNHIGLFTTKQQKHGTMCFETHDSMEERSRTDMDGTALRALVMHDEWMAVAYIYRQDAGLLKDRCNFFAVPLCSSVEHIGPRTPVKGNPGTQPQRRSFGVLGVDTSRRPLGTGELSEAQKDTIRKVALNLSHVVYKAHLAAAKDIKQMSSLDALDPNVEASLQALLESLAKSRELRLRLEKTLDTATARNQLSEMKQYLRPPPFALEIILAAMCLCCIHSERIQGVPVRGHKASIKSKAYDRNMTVKEGDGTGPENPDAMPTPTPRNVFFHMHKFTKYLGKASENDRMKLWEKLRRVQVEDGRTFAQMFKEAPMTEMEFLTKFKENEKKRRDRATDSHRSNDSKADGVAEDTPRESKVDKKLIPNIALAHDEAGDLLALIQADRDQIKHSSSSLLLVYNWCINIMSMRNYNVRKDHLIIGGMDSTSSGGDMGSSEPPPGTQPLDIKDILRGIKSNKRIQRNVQLAALEGGGPMLDPSTIQEMAAKKMESMQKAMKKNIPQPSLGEQSEEPIAAGTSAQQQAGGVTSESQPSSDVSLDVSHEELAKGMLSAVKSRVRDAYRTISAIKSLESRSAPQPDEEHLQATAAGGEALLSYDDEERAPTSLPSRTIHSGFFRGSQRKKTLPLAAKRIKHALQFMMLGTASSGGTRPPTGEVVDGSRVTFGEE